MRANAILKIAERVMSEGDKRSEDPGETSARRTRGRCSAPSSPAVGLEPGRR